MEARQLVSELARLLGDAGVEIVVADPGGSPLERYPVESVDSGPYGYREEVIWLELGNGFWSGSSFPHHCRARQCWCAPNRGWRGLAAQRVHTIASCIIREGKVILRGNPPLRKVAGGRQGD